MSRIKELLEAKQKELCAMLDVSNVISHPTGKGDNTEKNWKKFLEEILPKKYGIDRGYLIDSNGNESDQIDIIIYDALYSPLIITSQAGEKFIPVESVYAVVEVKPSINKNTLQYANEKIESVKKLKRSSRGMTCAGKRVERRKLTKILGVILATDIDIKEDTLRKHLETYKNIDIGCGLNKFSFNSIKNGNDVSVEMSTNEESLLGLFFNIHNELHEIGTVAAIDIREYANGLNSFNFDITEDFRNNE